jgi:hypothetical protein
MNLKKKIKLAFFASILLMCSRIAQADWVSLPDRYFDEYTQTFSAAGFIDSEIKKNFDGIVTFKILNNYNEKYIQTRKLKKFEVIKSGVVEKSIDCRLREISTKRIASYSDFGAKGKMLSESVIQENDWRRLFMSERHLYRLVCGRDMLGTERNSNQTQSELLQELKEINRNLSEKTMIDFLLKD